MATMSEKPYKQDPDFLLKQRVGMCAVIELECLAVTWAIKKCNIFLAGIDHFTVIMDHNPLIPILNTHRLDEIENPRL